MTGKKIEEAIDEAYKARVAGEVARAERDYANAAELARAKGDSGLLAHALRHVSDLARERGALEAALAAAQEAVAVYRAIPDCRPLDLANALRLNALALEAMDGADRPSRLWQEARALYAAVPVPAAVEECDRRLRSAETN